MLLQGFSYSDFLFPPLSTVLDYKERKGSIKKKRTFWRESFSLPPPSATKANSRSLCASHAHPVLLTGCLTRQTLILDTTLISWDQTARRCAPQVPRSAEIAPFHKSYVIASLISATESSWMWSLFPKFHILALQTYISYLKNTF